MHRFLRLAVLSLGVLLSTFVAAQGASYTFTTIDVPFPEATGTVVHGINSDGQMVGSYGSVQGGRGFLDDAGVFTSISAPSADNTDLGGINDQGQMVKPGQHIVYASGELRRLTRSVGKECPSVPYRSTAARAVNIPHTMPLTMTPCTMGSMSDFFLGWSSCP
jgi:hypothetical protein